MLEKIQNNYLAKEVFSFLMDERKLKIIKYNKNMQSKLNTNLTNYKLFSRRYIKYGENRIGKEYLILGDILAFEGEYLNKERKWKRERIL